MHEFSELKREALKEIRRMLSESYDGIIEARSQSFAMFPGLLDTPILKLGCARNVVGWLQEQLDLEEEASKKQAADLQPAALIKGQSLLTQLASEIPGCTISIKTPASRPTPVHAEDQHGIVDE